jgi:2,3-bisphosphoglycerate-independent phosphoglycerate mutase
MAKERMTYNASLFIAFSTVATHRLVRGSYVAALQRKMALEIGCGEIATIVGRYYAMDRDKRWERTQRAYDLLTKAIGERATDPIAAINESYERGVTDEFVEPIAIVRESGEPVATIKNGDCGYLLQLPSRSRATVNAGSRVPDFKEFPLTIGRSRSLSASRCTTRRSIFRSRFRRAIIATCSLKFLGGLCVRNYRLAETEKYAHVTYFFNGGVEKSTLAKNVCSCRRRRLRPTICNRRCRRSR